MNEVLKKRLKAGAWVILGTAVAGILTLLLENINEFGLSEPYKVLATAVLAGTITQITKYLNS